MYQLIYRKSTGLFRSIRVTPIAFTYRRNENAWDYQTFFLGPFRIHLRSESSGRIQKIEHGSDGAIQARTLKYMSLHIAAVVLIRWLKPLSEKTLRHCLLLRRIARESLPFQRKPAAPGPTSKGTCPAPRSLAAIMGDMRQQIVDRTQVSVS